MEINLCLLSGSLHVSAYEEDEGSLLTSHLGISTSEAGWRKLPFCPTRGKVRGKQLLFSGTTGVSFMAEMQQEGVIELAIPVPVKLSAKDTYPAVYQFIPTKDISSTQLDITVTSESDDVPAYLNVSRDCKDVKDNIDVVDYKGESLRLLFAKKGRITLSKFSIPPLTASTSSWFIGIAIKNASGDTPINARKKVTLTLKRSFDYSYTLPMWIVQCAICILMGLAVSIWAWCSFREYPCVNLCEIFSAMPCFPFIYLLIQGPKTFSYITLIVSSVLMVGSFQFVFADWYLMIQEGDRDHCYYNDFCYRVRYADIPYNLIVSNVVYVLHGLILAINVLFMESEVLAKCKKIASSAKKNREDRLRLACDKRKKELDEFINKRVYELTKEQKPSETMEEVAQNNGGGNSKEPDYFLVNISDRELPSHLLTCPDISLHCGEMLVPEVKPGIHENSFVEALKKRYSFSMGYALAWALFFQGMFSALYHFCPSRFTFQFDTAFMFVIAGLSVILLYNGIERQPCTAEVKAKSRVEAANLFLFFLVPLLIFNYFGTMYHSEAGLDKKFQIPFFFFLIVWFFIIASWAGYKLYAVCSKLFCKSCESHCECCKCCTCGCTKRFVLTLFCLSGFVVTPLVLIVLWSQKILEFTDAILWFCIAESVVASGGSFCAGLKCESSCPSNCQDCVEELKARLCFIIKVGSKVGCKVGSKVLYTCTILTLNGLALWIFFAKETTDKSKSPEKSRDLNQECIFLAFFDWHDVWHIFSSFGLFMAALMVIHTSYESLKLLREKSQTRATTGASDEPQSVPVEMDSPGEHDIPENAQNPLANNKDATPGFDDVKTTAGDWLAELKQVLPSFPSVKSPPDVRRQ